MAVFKADLLAALSARFFSLTRIRFLADLLVAKLNHLLQRVCPVIISLGSSEFKRVKTESKNGKGTKPALEYNLPLLG